ncbi:MAG TPA: hydroxymethylbilane synthase [Actinomycetota bacterium]|nr:hydroxymethylbilane synthase [Actinomycetota bacterium]
MALDRLVIASRGSTLALRQAGIVAELVGSVSGDIDVDVRTVKTRGDSDKRAFAHIGGKGLFVADVEREVAEGRADIAVHSAKDLTADLGPGCAIVCVPPRASVHDVVVGGTGDSGEERLGRLPEGATVGTSSMRRRALLSEARPELKAVEFRGNLDTRLRKVADGQVDVAVLAAAGIERLDADVSIAPLDPAWWIPPPGQGALAIEARSDRNDLIDLFAGVTDPAAAAEVACERAFSARLEGGCSVPLGCLARASGSELVATGFLGHPEGAESIRDRISGGVSEAEALGRELAEAILAGGGGDLLEEIRAGTPPSISPP